MPSPFPTLIKLRRLPTFSHHHCHHHHRHHHHSLLLYKPITTLLSPDPHSPTNQETQQDPLNPYSLMKEDPIQVISHLWLRSFSTENHTNFSNLTGFLKKFDLWVLAYQISCAHFTGSFPPKNAIHSHTLHSLSALQSAVLTNQFSWGSSTHLFIRSPTDKPLTKLISKRKLNTLLQSTNSPFQDRVVQELLLLILEPLFDPRFSTRSHAFRPGRSAHTVIRTIRSNFAGYLWFLKVDLSAIFDSVDSGVLMGCLGKWVSDKKVLGLIRSAVRSRNGSSSASSKDDELDKRKKRKKKGSKRKKIVLNENERKPDPYWLRTFFNFAPEEAAKVPFYGCCGILSPLLANLCLSELDNLMEDKIAKYFRPCKLDSIWRDASSNGSHNPAWPEFVPSSGREKTRRMDFIRYGAHVLIGIRGPREDAVETRRELIEFCESKFGLRLDNQLIQIEHISRGIQFLDHIICRRVIHPTLHYTATGGKIVSERGVGTLLSVTASLQQCIRQFRRLEFVKGDRDPEPLPCTPMLYASQAHTNSQMNKFLETMADWYRYADNRKKIVGFCAYVIRSSLAKLYAARYRLKSRAKVYKIASRDLSRPLRESTNNEAPEYSDLLRMGLVDAIDGVQFSHMSLIPSCDYTPFPRNWLPNHERVLREYIRLQDPKYFCELNRSVKREGLTLPQDELSEIVWEHKIQGVRGRHSLGDIKQPTALP